MISKSIMTLIILGFGAFFIFGLIIALILWDESNIEVPVTPIPPVDEYCNEQGFKNLSLRRTQPAHGCWQYIGHRLTEMTATPLVEDGKDDDRYADKAQSEGEHDRIAEDLIRQITEIAHHAKCAIDDEDASL